MCFCGFIAFGLCIRAGFPWFLILFLIFVFVLLTTNFDCGARSCRALFNEGRRGADKKALCPGECKHIFYIEGGEHHNLQGWEVFCQYVEAEVAWRLRCSVLDLLGSKRSVVSLSKRKYDKVDLHLLWCPLLQNHTQLWHPSHGLVQR